MYGPNLGQLRGEMATLLRQHRIQMRIGGPGVRPVSASTTVEQREALGQQIQRFRYAALMWCLHAVDAADPQPSIGVLHEPRWRPFGELRHRLIRSINLSIVGLPTLDELVIPQDFDIVERWRQVARAAALGEHDFPGVMNDGRLTTTQSLTVIGDAAETVRALVVLDKRYAGIPGWIPIRERGRLERAAQRCVVVTAGEMPDFAVDLKSWRSVPATIDGGPLPGIGGVIQAEHNLLVYLSEFPSALNLRRVIESQRILSHEAIDLAREAAPEFIEKWIEREQTYEKLTAEGRHIGGLVGNGGNAAAEAANAVGRLRSVRPDQLTGPEPLHDLDKLFTRTDVRIAAVIEHGVAERMYLVGVAVPRIERAKGQIVSPVRERYVPIVSPRQTGFVDLARERLAAAPSPVLNMPRAHDGRDDLRGVIVERTAYLSVPVT